MSLTKKWKLKSKPVDAVFVTEDNYCDVAEWCGGKVVDVHCVSVPTINTGAVKFSLKPTLAVAGEHVVFKNRQGYFVVLTVEQFEELWEPVDLERPLDTVVDN